MSRGPVLDRLPESVVGGLERAIDFLKRGSWLMRRTSVGAALGLVVVALVVLLAGDPPVRSPSTAPTPTTSQPSATPAADLTPDVERSKHVARRSPSDLVSRLDDVASSCGLEARPYCEGRTCVATARMPDLDHATGWFSMAFRNPRFVWSVARRDLGIPEEVLSCGVALEALDRVASVELDDGREVWCAFDGSERQAALCDRASRERYGSGNDPFQSPDLRFLSFTQ